MWLSSTSARPLLHPGSHSIENRHQSIPGQRPSFTRGYIKEIQTNLPINHTVIIQYPTMGRGKPIGGRRTAAAHR